MAAREYLLRREAIIFFNLAHGFTSATLRDARNNAQRANHTDRNQGQRNHDRDPAQIDRYYDVLLPVALQNDAIAQGAAQMRDLRTRFFRTHFCHECARNGDGPCFQLAAREDCCCVCVRVVYVLCVVCCALCVVCGVSCVVRCVCDVCHEGVCVVLCMCVLCALCASEPTTCVWSCPVLSGLVWSGLVWSCLVLS